MKKWFWIVLVLLFGAAILDLFGKFTLLMVAAIGAVCYIRLTFNKRNYR